MNILSASQKYVTKWLLRYDDELFGILYHDVDGSASSYSREVFEQGRSVSLYGVRGWGKTTLMQGILWEGLKNSEKGKFLPVNVSVTGTRGIKEQYHLEKIFYRSVLEGLFLAGQINERYDKLKKFLQNHSPWISDLGLSALGLVFPPAVIASSTVKKIIENLIKKYNITEQEFVISNEIDHKYAVNFIIKELEDQGISPIFAIDELDKVTSDIMLSDFFDGNQGWFQGKRCIISLSYTYGQSLLDSSITSVSRFSSIKKIEGISTLSQFELILESRLLLGISEVESNKNNVKKLATNIFSTKVSEQIVNNLAPNLHLMLEKAYSSITLAMLNKRNEVILSDVKNREGSTIIRLKKPQLLILRELSQSQMRPSQIADVLGLSRSTVSVLLSALFKKDLIGRLESGKERYYFIKQKGDTVLRNYPQQ